MQCTHCYVSELHGAHDVLVLFLYLCVYLPCAEARDAER